MTGAIFIVVMFALMWALVILPQQRRAKRHQALVASLGLGDEVVTAGGILGTVTDLGDDEVELAVADGVHLRVLRAAVAEVRAHAATDDGDDRTPVPGDPGTAPTEG